MRTIAKCRRVTLLGLGISLAFGAPLHVSAEAAQIPQRSSMTNPPGDNIHIGNGTHNYNRINIHTSTTSKGSQVVDNSSAGGRPSIRNAFCKKKRYCKIIQR
jgi:hypothetical protein